MQVDEEDEAADSVSDKMEVISLARTNVSHGSKKSSSTLSSLLSNKSLELVFGLIDDYYQHVYCGPQQPSTAELLGNLAPSSGHHGQGLDALVAAADVANVAARAEERKKEPLPDVIVRAMHIAEADGKRLQELLVVLTAAQSHASVSPGTPREHLQRLDSDLSEVKGFLSELDGIQVCCLCPARGTRAVVSDASRAATPCMMWVPCPAIAY